MPAPQLAGPVPGLARTTFAAFTDPVIDQGHVAFLATLAGATRGVASYAEELARMTGQDAEQSFLAGLFHDVGHALVLQEFVDIAGCFSGIVDRCTLLAAAELHSPGPGTRDHHAG